MLQRHAIEVLHDNEGLPVFLSNFMDSADIRMVQCGRRLRFALEACQGLNIFGDIVGQEFERDQAMQPGVFRFVHHAHAAAPEFLDNAVVRDDLVNH